MRFIEVTELDGYRRLVSVEWIAEVHEVNVRDGGKLCKVVLKNDKVCFVLANIRGLFEMIQSAEEL